MTTYRRRFLTGLVLAAAGMIAGACLEGSKARAAATLLLLAAAAMLGLAGYRLHRTRHERTFLRNALLVYAPYAAVALLLAAALRIWLILAPPGRIAIAEIPAAQLAARIEKDFAQLSSLRTQTCELLSKLQKPYAPTSDLAAVWTNTVICYRGNGDFVETYKGFHRIDYVAHPQLHTGALVIGLWACVQQQMIAQSVAQAITSHPELRPRLDAYYAGLGKDNASAMIRSMGSDTTLWRIHAGAAYLTLVNKDIPSSFSDAFPVLQAELAAVQRSSGPDALRAVTDPLKRLRELDLQRSKGRQP